MSKALATLATQPLIVAKVGLQSRPPSGRQGKPFKSFVEVMSYIIEQEGPLALFKGIVPQITKGILVQGFLMMTKERSVIICYAAEETLTGACVGWNSSSSFYLRTCESLGRTSCRRWPKRQLPGRNERCLQWRSSCYSDSCRNTLHCTYLGIVTDIKGGVAVAKLIVLCLRSNSLQPLHCCQLEALRIKVP